MSSTAPPPLTAARSLHGQLRRLARAFAHRVGRRRARRLHLLLLVAAAVLAFISRALWDVPGIAALEGNWGPTLLACAALLGLGPALSWLLGSVVRPLRQHLAYDLDDTLQLKDQAGTAVETLAQPDASPLGEALREAAADRLRRADEDRLWKRSRKVPWLRAFLVLLFAFFLLGPGVDGLFGDRGVGRGDDSGIGPRDEGLAPGKRRPMRADTWMLWFAEDPMPVESLGGPPAKKDDR